MPEMRQITSGLQFPEGPVALADGSVAVVEIKRGTLTRVAPDGKQTIVAMSSGGQNGADFGPECLVYVCNNGGFELHDVGGLLVPGNQAHDYSGGRIQRVDLATGKVEDLYSACDGRALRGPNDIVFDASGGFWFTDHGKMRERDRDRTGVFYARADGSRIREVLFPLDAPNGIGLSPHRLRRPRAPHRVRHGLRHRAAARHRMATAGPSPRVPMTRLAVALLCLALSPALVGAQDSLWEKYMAAGAESYGKGQFAEAEKMWLAARKEAEASFRPADLPLAAPLSNPPELHRRQGKHPQAATLPRRPRAITQKAKGSHHPQVASIVNNLGTLYATTGRVDAAERMFRRALILRERTLGPDSLEVASSLDNLALLYHDEDHFQDAVQLHRRALAIRERALGPSHPGVTVSLTHLASLYTDLGRYAEAEPLYRRILTIRQSALGQDHPDVAAALDALAELYRKQGKFALAEPLYKQSLAIKEKALGAENPGLVPTLNEAALFYQAQGKYADAEPLYRRALTINEKTFGPNDPELAKSLNSLAELCRKESKFGEAESLFKRALAIGEKSYGANHPEVASLLENYAVLLHQMGREQEAAPLEARARAIRSNGSGN